MDSKRKLDAGTRDNPKPAKAAKFDNSLDDRNGQEKLVSPCGVGLAAFGKVVVVPSKLCQRPTAKRTKPGVNFHSIEELSRPSLPQTEILRPQSADLCQGRDSVSPAGTCKEHICSFWLFSRGNDFISAWGWERVITISLETGLAKADYYMTDEDSLYIVSLYVSAYIVGKCSMPHCMHRIGDSWLLSRWVKSIRVPR